MDKLEKKWYHFVNFFYIFCVIGWIYEVIWEFGVGNGFVNRGFLFGPHLPIYGFGVLILYFILRRLIKKDIKIGKLKITPIIVFLAVMIIVSVIEYIGSVFLEKCFNQELWNYSYDVININGTIIPLNLNGRISLRNSTFLSLGAMVMLYIIWPFLEFVYSKIKDNVVKVLAIFIICGMSVDLIFTLMKNFVK